jgi:methylmalonyl-CoA/ethylmalonyl-CoA epimerase
VALSAIWTGLEDPVVIGIRNSYNVLAEPLDVFGEGEALMFVGVDHVGIAVKNLDDAVHVYRDVLGFKLEGIHVLAERSVRVALMSASGETRIELLEPLGGDSAIARFLESHGEGIHHFAVEVEDIESVLAGLKEKGVMLIDDRPKSGVGGRKVAFVHPKSTKGVLLELVME